MTVPYTFAGLTGTAPIKVPASQLDADFAYLLSPIATGGSTARSLQDRFADVKNVLDFGGDKTGNADLVPALAAAMAAMPAGGGVIFIPPGLYRMDAGFPVTKTGVSIVGGGWGNTVIFPHSDFGAPMFDLQGYSQTISNIQINGEQGALTVTGAANNGSGLIRLTLSSAASLTTGNVVLVTGLTGTTEANATWTVTKIDSTHIDLQGSTFSNAYVSGGVLLRYINVTGIKVSTVSAANIIVDNVFVQGVATGLWTAACNDGRFNRLRIESCAVGVLEGQGGAGLFASELHFTSIAVVPFGQVGNAWVIDYNAFSNQHELITTQGGVVGLTIESTQAHNGTTIVRPNGHYFGGDFNIDHGQLAACSITSGWNTVFGNGTLTGTQAGPGLLVSRSSATNNDLDGIELRGTYVGGNATHGIQLATGANFRAVDCRIYGNSVSPSATYDGINVASTWIGQCEILVNMFGPSSSADGGWGGLTAIQAYAIRLASGALTDTANYGSGGITLKGRLHIEGNTYATQGTGLVLDASAPTFNNKYIDQSVNAGFGQILLKAVDFNQTNTDNAITVTIPPGYTRYLVNSLRISGASASLTTATCGLFTATGAGGIAIVTSGTAITVNTSADATNNNTQTFTINNGSTLSYTATTLYFRVQTPEGSAATADVALVIVPLP